MSHNYYLYSSLWLTIKLIKSLIDTLLHQRRGPSDNATVDFLGTTCKVPSIYSPDINNLCTLRHSTSF